MIEIMATNQPSKQQCVSPVSGETRRGGEDKMLEDLAGWVTEIYRSCIGENVVTIPSAVSAQWPAV